MALIELTVDEHVAIITMNDNENRFNPEFLQTFLAVLDQVEHKTETRTLIVQSAHEKIFSNGIDLEWLVGILHDRDLDAAKAFFYLLNQLFKRILTFPLITVAAINGHAFAGGAILCCAFDFRFMRSDRGFFCFPEVDLGIPFLPGMNAMLKKALPMYMVEEMQYTGNRLTAEDCEKHHIIRKACHVNNLMDEVLTFAKGLKKERGIVAEMKKRLNQSIIYTLENEDIPFIESGKFNIG